MPTASTQAIWRSAGGDTTKTAYLGSMLMVADFYFVPTAVVSTAVRKSATDASAVILPVGAVVIDIQVNAAATGGTNPTIDMGFTLNSNGTNTPSALLNETDADAGKQAIDWATATAGASLGVAMSATEMVRITGGVGASAATGGTVTGKLFYYVPTTGAYAS